METKDGLLIAGGLGVVGVVAIAMMGGKTTTQGVTFAAPNPSSVAAVQSAAASEVSSVNALAVQRSQIASQTLLGLETAQRDLGLGAMAARSTDLQTVTAGNSVALQQATSVHATDVAGNVANYATMIAGGVANFGAQTAADTAQLASNNTLLSQNYQTSVNAGAAEAANQNALTAAIASIKAQLQATQITSSAAVQQTQAQARASIAQSNNQTTQAQAAAGAQKTSSWLGAITSIASKFIPSPAPGAGGAGGSPSTAVTPGSLGFA